ncbi:MULTISPECIES: single-stranded DNA-binding protein [unclassified Brenneria]|uniref:single-stranded DNA-binding protein n=1 Tax=unclassified Brenneria TaxID=2634434 RepID=UPI0018F0FDE6|nr:single-stranded DNA-binding protein [Brenneria sp. L3-3C-1]MBJ7223608.1 single-stranded DNA-binding protein [Brenneria sp. L3-3C-1]MEE3644850.1 single-stranded DNA-binding protein [Brenneria sp. L3_3C_1]
MSTHFSGEGNIGSAPEFHEYPNGNEEPRRVLRLNIYFDNPVPGKNGKYEDRGGFWRPVEWWHRDAEHWATLFQKGMRIVVRGREERDDWTDENNNPRTTYRVNARSVGILPYRLESVVLSPKQQEIEEEAKPTEAAPPKEAKAKKTKD